MKMSDFELPIIVGKSEKQVAYAKSVREKYITAPYFEDMYHELVRAENGGIAKYMEKRGVTEDVARKKYIVGGAKIAHVLLNETDASKILDTFKR